MARDQALGLYIDDHGTINATITHIKRFLKRTLRGIEEQTDKFAYELRDEVRKRAEGRPGPERRSGGYWNSIQVRETETKLLRTEYRRTVSSDHPAAARLEKGYVGVDSMGRSYNQPPFPHWDPAIQYVAPRWLASFGDKLPEWWNG